LKKKITVILLVVILLTSIMFSMYTGNLRTVKANGQSSDSNGNSSSWPMFQGGLDHTGYTTSTAPSNNNSLWSTYITGGVYDSAAVSNGMVYFGSQFNEFYCLNATNGVVIWGYEASGGIDQCSPAVAGGMVYFGANNSPVGNLTCLNAATGAFVWNCTIGQMQSCPAVSNGLVYVGDQNDYVYCINATSGAVEWSYKTRGDIIWSSPAVSGGFVYIGSNDFNIYCFNATSGSLAWKYNVGNTVSSAPAISDGMVYFGSLNGNVYCLNASTGVPLWSFKTYYQSNTQFGNEIYSSPAVANGMVYIGSMDGTIYCLNANSGAQIWNYTTWCPTATIGVRASPAVADGMVYVGNTYGILYCLDANSGSQIWNASVAGGYSSAAIASGVLYIGSTDSDMCAFGSALVASASLSTIDVGGTSILTSPAVTAGIPPLKYQWFSEAPSASAYSLVSGATSSSYNFATLTTTVTGNYNFMLQVTDDIGAAVNSTVATVQVNSALVAPTVTPTPSTVTQGQTSSLASSAVMSGSSPYTYRWFNETPGAAHYSTIADASLSSYNFATTSSTATGTWNFILEVTDSAGASVNSTATSVTVNAPAPTSTPTPAATSTPAPTVASTPTQTSTPSQTPTPSPPSVQSATSTTTVTDNSATVDQSAKTGVNVVVSGSSLQDGTQVNVTSTKYGDSQPSETGSISVTGAVFYDVSVTSSSGALSSGISVKVSISNPAFSSASVIEYWNGNSWVSVATTFTAPDTVSGTVPASALTGTFFVVGNPRQVAEFPSIILTLIVFLMLGVLFVYVKKRNQSKPQRKQLVSKAIHTEQ
jgi:outer membrane protein assembly factor BamB